MTPRSGAGHEAELGGRRSILLGPLVELLYRVSGSRVRKWLLRIVVRREGGAMHSLTLRAILRRHEGVEVGLFADGAIGEDSFIGPGVTIGRYASIGRNVVIVTRDHPTGLVSSHGLFFNPTVGIVAEYTNDNTRLVIGHDVRIGERAVVLPSVNEIGIGAVIEAGAVVHKNIPPFAIVRGHPCHVAGYRLPPGFRAAVVQSRWWNLAPGELRSRRTQFQLLQTNGPPGPGDT